MAESTARGFLGAGDLYMDLYKNGAYAGYVGPIECNKFEIKPNSELKELVSKSRGYYGQPVASVNLPRPFDLSIGVSQVDKNTLAMAMFGAQAALTPQVSGALTDESIANVKHDVWTPTSKVNFLSGVTVKVAAATKVNGTDYIVDMTMGRIKVLSTGTIADAATILVSATYGAMAGTRIRGAAESVLKAKFQLVGKNFVDNSDVIITVHEATIAPDAAWDMLADDFNTLEMPCRMAVPAGFLEPFTIDLRNPT